MSIGDLPKLTSAFLARVQAVLNFVADRSVLGY